jgi:CheY-like chemotaxis protein
MTELLFGRRVLLIEDEMLILIMIEDMLADLGCTSITTAATVDQALALIDAEIFDVAMLDMNLNGDKTFAVADALAVRNVPFVFSTGYSGPNIRDDHRDRPILKKPFMDAQLVEVLTRLLAQ